MDTLTPPTAGKTPVMGGRKPLTRKISQNALKKSQTMANGNPLQRRQSFAQKVHTRVSIHDPKLN